MNEGDKIYMTELLAQLKEAQRDKAEAEKEVTVWTERAKLAEKAGKRDLYAAAMERVDRYAESLRDAESRIMDLEVKKSVFKREAKQPDTSATQRANKLLADIADKPWAPTGSELDKLSREASADDALAALKKKMSSE